MSSKIGTLVLLSSNWIPGYHSSSEEIMSVKMRQLVEKEIATAVVDALLAAGFSISIDNTDTITKPMTNRSNILKALFLTDEDRLYAVANPSQPSGWVYLVYGNDGWDVLSDYSVNLEKLIGNGTAVYKLIDKYSD
jgi:hypothetical protein